MTRSAVQRRREEIYTVAKPPKYLMALNQGIHFEPYEEFPSPHDGAVIAATTAFWDGYLKDARQRDAS